MKKFFVSLLGVILILILGGCQKETGQSWETMETKRVSIHDPSVTSIVEEGQEIYYIFGSHLAEAKTTDLSMWEVPFNSEYEDPEDNIILGNLDENLKESFEWAGKDDADSVGGYAIWAPDVIWNPEYVFDNGDQGAYMYYYCTTSTWRRSCIGYAVSKNIEGPYEYVDTILYSGFSEVDATDGSDRNIQYENTNLKQLLADGEVEGFSEKWTRKNGSEYNTDYAPNAIDPALFFDEEGKLWMTYGSWSGGIFILEMDAKTGKPTYPGNDAIRDDGQIVDRYFGVKLSGGYHQSGEGPFIVYDDTTNYYYLFVTYGALQSNGGYNMRLFRSENPDGPYLDAKGNDPVLNVGDKNDDYGIKVMGNYQFSEMPKAYKAEGHNSALIDQDGQWLLFYHTRFSNNGEAHEVRVHEMKMNQVAWPVTLPYEYRSQTVDKTIRKEDVVGSYQYINHGTKTDGDVIKAEEIQLNEDQSITGSVDGRWSITENNFLTIIIDGVSYQGVVTYQSDETTSAKEVLVFSAIGENNETIWGSQK